jgi:hypothetical protein
MFSWLADENKIIDIRKVNIYASPNPERRKRFNGKLVCAPFQRDFFIPALY